MFVVFWRTSSRACQRSHTLVGLSGYHWREYTIYIETTRKISTVRDDIYINDNVLVIPTGKDMVKHDTRQGKLSIQDKTK